MQLAASDDLTDLCSTCSFRLDIGHPSVAGAADQSPSTWGRIDCPLRCWNSSDFHGNGFHCCVCRTCPE